MNDKTHETGLFTLGASHRDGRLPITLAGLLACASLTLCGCKTDSPIFAPGVANPTGNEQSTAEMVRDINNVQNSGASMGSQRGNGNPHISNGNGSIGAGNPYGH